jgi:hypothetical protein
VAYLLLTSQLAESKKVQVSPPVSPAERDVVDEIGICAEIHHHSCTSPPRSREGQQMEQHDVILHIRTGDVLSLDTTRREKSESSDETMNYPVDRRERRAGRRVPA